MKKIGILLIILLMNFKAQALSSNDACFEFVNNVSQTVIGYFDLLPDEIVLEEENTCRKYFLKSEDFDGYTLILDNQEGGQCVLLKMEMGLNKNIKCSDIK